MPRAKQCRLTSTCDALEAAARVITPDPLLPVSGGMGAPRPAREKRGEITARAVVVRKGEVTVAVVALDLLGFPSVLGDRVRAKVDRIPSKNILIGSTHTHSAPDCYAFPDGQGGHTGTSLGERTGEILIETLLEFVNRSPAPDR